MKQPRQKSTQEIWDGATELQRRIIAEGIATMHHFSAKPTFKYGKPVYKHSNTVEAIAHAREKAKRKSKPSAQ
jgi:hypothetical protein